MNTVAYDSLQERRVWRVVPDLIQARELLRDLVWKDLRVRYRYAMMGFLWAVIEPLAFTLILTFVFAFVLEDKAAMVRPDGAPPFALMLLCGLIFWQHFSAALNAATVSVVVNKNLVKKVRFAREVIPIAACCMPLVQLAIGFALLLMAQALFGGRFSGALVYIPALFAVQFALTIGLALFLACAHVLFRDVGALIGVLLMFGFYASPVFYPLTLLQGERVPLWIYRLYMLNPMAGLLTGYRQVLLESRAPDPGMLLWPVVCAALSLVCGAFIFRRYAATLSDYL